MNNGKRENTMLWKIGFDKIKFGLKKTMFYVERIMAAASPEVQAELQAHSDEFRARVNKHATVREHIPARSGSVIPFFNTIYRHVPNYAKRRGAEALLLLKIAKDFTKEKPHICTCYHDDQPESS